jgi:hypothetical protein
MSRRDPESVLSGRLGRLDASWVLKALDNAGYAVITKSEHLALRRAQIKLAKVVVVNEATADSLKKRAALKNAKSIGGGHFGTRTARISVTEENLSQVPTEPLVKKAAVTKKATKPIIVTDAMTKQGIGTKASAKKAVPSRERAKATKTNVAAKKTLPRKRVTRRG